MVKKNPQFSQLEENYLFPEIQKKKLSFLEKNPAANIISLGIGDTTLPIGLSIAEKMAVSATGLATTEGYSGYGPEQGSYQLREMISQSVYHTTLDPDSIFISDGAKCDTGRLLHLFEGKLTLAIQDPAYPVYLDTAILSGKVENILLLPCKPENDFFPDLDQLSGVDLIYFCSPNNPTGHVATKKQLQKLVKVAQENKAILIFDAAYASYITDHELPRSIYEIEGAETVAIEINSFSKCAGFTGIRLGWTVIPKALKFDDGSDVHPSWNRVTQTFFNGASNIAQTGGIASLESKGMEEAAIMRRTYLENAALIRDTFESLGIRAFGGINSPFVWIEVSPKKSWEAFDEFLTGSHVITVPGIGFGPSGEGFLRLSAFGKREEILEAMARISHHAISLVSK